MAKKRCKTSKNRCCRTCSVLYDNSSDESLNEATQMIADAQEEVKEFAGKDGTVTAVGVGSFYIVTGCKRDCKKKKYY